MPERKDGTNRTNGEGRGIQAECEEKLEGKGGWKKEKNLRVRERSDARESASAGVIWKCWSNISFRLDSAILLSASRRLPLYPKPSRGGWSRWWRRSRARYREWGWMLDRGLKRPIEDLQTRCHPLSLPSFLIPSVSFRSRFTTALTLLLPASQPLSILLSLLSLSSSMFIFSFRV